ncbi:hypothetical protein HDV01_003487 [Terramyces sp. JEL0728]|nr:hypothetical protein HDV01_003487 [Terramyces sp. JEL0728]
MTSLFWKSSHCDRWLNSKPQITMDVKDYYKLCIYYASVTNKLAKSISKRLNTVIRQQVISTALVYFKRFFTKNHLADVDCLLVISACFYLASKTEECPIHIKSVVNEMNILYRQEYPYDAVILAEFEFLLLEDLEFHTIVYHPYRPLTQIINHLKLDIKVLQTARYLLTDCSFILNDSYRTDLCLYQPPHVIALTALYITSVLHSDVVPENVVLEFFQSANVDMFVVVECTQEIFNLYSVWEEYSESQANEILAK